MPKYKIKIRKPRDRKYHDFPRGQISVFYLSKQEARLTTKKMPKTWKKRIVRVSLKG